MDVLIVFAGIVALFIVLLAFKRVAPFKFCVLCVSVALTWLALLVSLWLGYYENPVLLTLLMGQSIVGIYYMAEKRLPEEYMVFRLAGLLTLTYLVYSVVASFLMAPLVLLLGLWIVSGFVFAYRNNPKLKATADHIIACCRDW